MPIPFLDHGIAGDGPSAAVAYLRFLHPSGESRVQGALFITNERGFPLEFCFTRVALASGPLWDPAQAYHQAVVALVKALFEAANHLPDLVLALANETPSEIFTEYIGTQVPVSLVVNAGAERVTLQWVGREPSAGSQLSSLVEFLKSRKLVLEPFQRAEQGLLEAFANQ